MYLEQFNTGISQLYQKNVPMLQEKTQMLSNNKVENEKEGFDYWGGGYPKEVNAEYSLTRLDPYLHSIKQFQNI